MGPNTSHSKLSWPVLLALAVNIGLALSYIGLWIIAARDQLLWRADFSMFYTGGTMIRSGLSDRLYNWDVQADIQQELLGGRSFSEGVLPYNYPPHVAVLFALLAGYSLSQAYSIWIVIQILIVCMLIYMLVKFTRKWQPIEAWLTITACLALPGMMRSFLLGALTPLLLLCILAWYDSLKRNADTWAGGWLFICFVKPQYAVGPVITSIIGRRWKAIALMGLAGILLVVWIGSTIGWHVWIDFFKNLIASSSYYNEFGINPAAMYNLKGTLTLMLGSTWATQINFVSLIGFLFSLVLTAWLWLGKWDPQKTSFPLRVSITLFLSIFFSLHVNLQDGWLIALPLLFFYEYLRQRNLSRKSFAILALSSPALFLLDEFFLNNWLPIRLAVVVMLVMLIWSGVLLHAENEQLISERDIPAI